MTSGKLSVLRHTKHIGECPMNNNQSVFAIIISLTFLLAYDSCMGGVSFITFPYMITVSWSDSSPPSFSLTHLSPT
jgi:hypothetical protein